MDFRGSEERRNPALCGVFIFPRSVMRKSHTFLLLLSFLANNYSHADLLKGEEEYDKAILASSQLQEILLEEKSHPIEKEESARKEQLREAILKSTATYKDNLETSAKLGFAPAQHLLAYTLTFEKPKNEKRICELLELASHQGLLASSLAKRTSCSESRNIMKIIEAQQKATHDIATGLSSADPYSRFYPIQAFQRPECEDLPSLGENPTLEEMTAALAAPKLSLAQFTAEAHFIVARYEKNLETKDALQHLSQAEESGCKSQHLVNIKRNLTKRLEQQKLGTQKN